MSSSLCSLDYHREAHASSCADSHQPQLSAAAPQLIEKRRGDSGSGCTEWMSERDRAAHHVELCSVHFADRLGKTGALGPPFRFEPFEVRQHLCGKRFMHLYQIDVLQRKAGSLERDWCGQYRSLKQLLPRIERRVRVRPDDPECRITKCLCFLLAHEENTSAAIGERRRVAGRYASVLPVEDGLEYCKLLVTRVLTNTVIRR